MSPSQFRILIFLVILLSLSTLEFFFSYRKRVLSRKSRWPGHLGLILISNVLGRLLLPSGLIVFADYAQVRNWGLLNLVDFAVSLKIIFAILLLDFSIYLQHILFHKIPFLWRIHRVHHADVDLDATSALRFHPIEILISLGIKIFLIFLWGVPAEAVLIFEVILSSMAMFNHSNLHLPKTLEKVLRLLIVTPQMHIVHHSIEVKETDTNFGFNLSVWDRLFKTYKPSFETSGVIGQTDFRNEEDQRLDRLLVLPF